MEDSVSKEVAQISDRVKREQAFTSLLQTKDPRVQLFMDEIAKLTGKPPGDIDEFLAKVWQDAILGEATSKVARSETLVSDEERKQISDKADSLRTWLWTNGRAPINEETDTANEAKRIWEDDKFRLVADEEGPPKNKELNVIEPALLFAEEKDSTQNTRVTVTMGFDGTYHLGIFYDEKGKEPHFYGSAIRPMNEMAGNEATIISGVLDDVIKSQSVTS